MPLLSINFLTTRVGRPLAAQIKKWSKFLELVNISNPPSGFKEMENAISRQELWAFLPLFFTQLKLRTGGGGGAEKSPLFFRRFRLNLKQLTVASSVADPWCLSRILIFTHPGSRISGPGSKNSSKREGWKKFVVIPFFVATNFT